MNYPLYEINDEEFELVVASICEETLWMGTIIFSSWKDWWRDAKFTWRANNFPSKSKPWDWKIIIQAKHTVKIGASCSDTDFISILKWSNTKKGEIEKVKKLKEDKKIDYYILFTNRKLSWIQDAKIENLITEKIWVTNIIIWEERIQKFLQDYPLIAKRHNLKRLFSPLEFYEDDLVNIINTFSQIDFNNIWIKEKIEVIEGEIKKIPIEDKNQLNSLSKDYFDNSLKKSYEYFSSISTFLKDEKNSNFKEMYENTVLDINEQILVKRDEFKEFEEILAYLYEYVLSSNIEFKNNRRYIRVFLHYMYYICDIGKS